MTIFFLMYERCPIDFIFVIISDRTVQSNQPGKLSRIDNFTHRWWRHWRSYEVVSWSNSTAVGQPSPWTSWSSKVCLKVVLSIIQAYWLSKLTIWFILFKLIYEYLLISYLRSEIWEPSNKYTNLYIMTAMMLRIAPPISLM